jgi:hypothetical protein
MAQDGSSAIAGSARDARRTAQAVRTVSEGVESITAPAPSLLGLRFGAFPLARHGVPFGLLSTIQRESNGSHEFSAHPLAFLRRNEQERERWLICARVAPVSRALRCPATPARRASRHAGLLVATQLSASVPNLPGGGCAYTRWRRASG